MSWIIVLYPMCVVRVLSVHWIKSDHIREKTKVFTIRRRTIEQSRERKTIFSKLSINCSFSSASRSGSPQSNIFTRLACGHHLWQGLLTRLDPAQTQCSSSCHPSTSSSNSHLSLQSACTPHRDHQQRYRYDRIPVVHRCRYGN